MFEPGRVICGNAGVLLTKVVRVKRSSNQVPFVVVDAAMNDLARPAMYGAWHDFDAVKPTGERMTAHIVGPICETGDTFAMDRDIRCDGCGRSRGIPHRRSLWRDHGQLIQQPWVHRRSDGRW
jgi:diaminopimelate decarboxylase